MVSYFNVSYKTGPFSMLSRYRMWPCNFLPFNDNNIPYMLLQHWCVYSSSSCSCLWLFSLLLQRLCVRSSSSTHETCKIGRYTMNFLLGMSQTRAYATPRKQYSTVLGGKTGRGKNYRRRRSTFPTIHIISIPTSVSRPMCMLSK